MHPQSPAAPITGPPTTPLPGWYADPWAPPGWRWWDGRAWTNFAAPGYSTFAAPGVAPAEPEESRRFFPKIPDLPIAAAWLGIATMVALTVASRAVTALPELGEALVSLVIVVATVIGMPLVAIYGAKRWGSRGVRHDLGLKAKLDDLWIGPVGMILLTISVVVVAVIVSVLQIPEGSNLEEVEELGRNGAVFILLFVMAGIVAPITEEMIFRGLIQRGLTGRLGIPLAIVVQGLIFGAAHITPSQGWGNVSLIASLSVLGMLLGVIAQLTGRLTAPIIAHALFNMFQLTLLWISLG